MKEEKKYMDPSIFIYLFIMFMFVLVFVGIAAMCIFACASMAKSKGLSSGWMWFGLLGPIGIIVLALKESERKEPTFTYGQSGNFYQGGYVQNPQNVQQSGAQYAQPYTQPYTQPYAQQNGMEYTQPYAQQNSTEYAQSYPQNSSGIQQQATTGTTCSFCGMQVSSGVKECPVCASKVN